MAPRIPDGDRVWLRPTLLLCFYGFFKYVKPSEPFLTPYLMGPIHNLTAEEVVNQIYPVWTYSYLALLLPIFLLTDYLKYKPIILLEGLGLIGCWLLLLFARGVRMMQLMQVCYAIATAGEIGYYSYIYSIVDESHYQRVTSYVRSTTLVGTFIASLLSQLLVSLANLEYFYLNVISLVDVSIAFLISCFLPIPKTTLFFFSSNSKNKPVSCLDNEDNSDKVSMAGEGAMKSNGWFSSFRATLSFLWTDIKQCYSNVILLRWSVWWALSTCGWLLVVNYTQNLWETIRPSSENEVYNGAVESAATVLGALGAFSVGYLKVEWSKWGELCLSFFSLLKCGLLMLMYWTTNIWACYAAYVIFICMYNVIITITQFQLAVGLTTTRFALVFGVNMFAAVGLNTALTVILVDKAGLGLNVNTQFLIYSVYFGVVSLIFLSHALYYVCFKRRRSRNEESHLNL